MNAPYDIGIGRCSQIEGDFVYVRLDALIAKRLAPESAWSRSGTSVLRFRNAICSRQRPPQVGAEVYLSSEALDRSVVGEIDVLGNNKFDTVDLSIILTAMSPISAARTPSVKLTYPRRSK